MSELQDLKWQNKAEPDSLLVPRLAKLRLELHSMLQENHNLLLQQLKRWYYVSHNKAGKFLASRLKAYRNKSKTPFLYHPSIKQKLTNPKQVADAFTDFSGSLYNLKDDPSHNLLLTQSPLSWTNLSYPP